MPNPFSGLLRLVAGPELTLRAGALLLALGLPPLALPAQTTVVLVRHAEKLAPSGDPSLSPAGKVRADALATATAGLALDGILVSQFRRTRETAAPTAAALGLKPEVVPVDRDLDLHVRETAARVRAFPPGSAILVVGHSNTLGPIIRALGGPEIAEICDAEYATMFVLLLAPDRRPRLLRTGFGPPDPADAGACRRADK